MVSNNAHPRNPSRSACLTSGLASGEPEEAAYVSRDIYGHTRRARVPETDVYDLFATAISELEIFGDTETSYR